MSISVTSKTLALPTAQRSALFIYLANVPTCNSAFAFDAYRPGISVVHLANGAGNEEERPRETEREGRGRECERKTNVSEFDDGVVETTCVISANVARLLIPLTRCIIRHGARSSVLFAAADRGPFAWGSFA